MVGFCSGTIAGLVAATPASGFIQPWAAVIMGIVTGAVCNYATKLKSYLKIDDALDLFAEHAIGGVIGLLANGLFASHSVIALDGVNTNINGGWVDHNYKQLYIQFAYVCAVCAYTFVVTAIIAKVVDTIPGLHLRTTPEGESLGLDEVEIGEFANDYIEVRRDYSDWTMPGKAISDQASEVPTADTYNIGERHGQPDCEPKEEIHHTVKDETSLEPIVEKCGDDWGVPSEVTPTLKLFVAEEGRK